jgi:hypothetical protein
MYEDLEKNGCRIRKNEDWKDVKTERRKRKKKLWKN